jgi:deoxycytidine triphosphate deaminase
MTPTLDGLAEVARRLPPEALLPWFEARQDSPGEIERLFREWLRLHPDHKSGVLVELESRLHVLARLAAATYGTVPTDDALDVYLGSGVVRQLLRSGHMSINPYAAKLVHVDGVDLRLGDAAWWQRSCGSPVRASDIGTTHFQQLHRKAWLSDSAPLILKPGAFVVVPTLEDIVLPASHAAIVQNTSSQARLGVLVVLAEHIHAGHKGKIMLEIKNLGDLTLSYVPGDKVAQLILKRVDGAGEAYGDNMVPYGNNSGSVDGLNGRCRRTA